MDMIQNTVTGDANLNISISHCEKYTVTGGCSFDTADIEVSSAMDASGTCEDGFKEMKVKRIVSPLTKDNNIFFQLSAISLAFINICH
nr:putative invertase inhibitor [Quercus suber]